LLLQATFRGKAAPAAMVGLKQQIVGVSLIRVHPCSSVAQFLVAVLSIPSPAIFAPSYQSVLSNPRISHFPADQGTQETNEPRINTDEQG
jgi:hypothetical protein